MSNFWKGPALPWGLEIPSVIDPKEDYDVIRSSILWIILCSFGERVMLPDFGSLLPELVFQPNDETTNRQVQESVKDAIQKWDDRVIFVSFGVEIVQNQLRCKVLYKLNIDQLRDDIQILEFNLTEAMVAR